MVSQLVWRVLPCMGWLALRVEMGRISVRPWITLAQRVRKIHAQRDFDPFQCVEEKEPQLLVKQVEVDRMRELGASRRLLDAQSLTGLVRIGHALLKRLPV